MVRAGNEDTFLVLNLNTADTWTPVTVEGEPPETLMSFHQGEQGSILAVSDGMGGALAGEVASRMAVEGVRERMLQFQSNTLASFPFHERLRLAVEQANIHINTQSMGNAEYAGMGATFTAAGVHEGCLVLAQIGDSRCYLVRDGRIHLLTHDQSLVWQLVEAGHITEEEAETHQYKNVILQALGAQPRVNVVVDKVKLNAGDTILLCSDGLSGRVRADEMLQIITGNDSLREACARLIQLANERGGDDNITVIVARFEGEMLPPPDDLDARRLERDPELPYEVDQDTLSDGDPDDTIPFGTAAGMPEPNPAAAAAARREAGARPASTQGLDPFSVTSVGMPAVTHAPPAPARPVASAESPPATPPPQVVRAPATRPGRGPLFGLLLAGALLGAILLLVWVFQIRQSNASNQPAPRPTPQPQAVTPAPAVAPPGQATGDLSPGPSAAADRFAALERKAGELEGRAGGLKPDRQAALKPLLQSARERLAKAKQLDTPPAEAAALVEEVDRDLQSIEREYFPPGADPLSSDGR